MKKRKLKWANIVGIMVFGCALVLNIQSGLNGEITIFQSGVAQTSGSEPEPPGSGTECKTTESTDSEVKSYCGGEEVLLSKRVVYTCVQGAAGSCTEGAKVFNYAYDANCVQYKIKEEGTVTHYPYCN